MINKPYLIVARGTAKSMYGSYILNPTIAFNAVNNVKSNSLRALTVHEIRDNYNKYAIVNTAKQVAKAAD
ncbi:MAG: hypothetical protein E6040_05940 [Lachnospiraceae bacterium]|nr:hypothetical protein [Lachnospiraceae bacterium]